MLYTSLLSSAGAAETSGRCGGRVRTETKAVRRIEPGAQTAEAGRCHCSFLAGSDAFLLVAGVFNRILGPNSLRAAWPAAIAGDAVVRVAAVALHPDHGALVARTPGNVHPPRSPRSEERRVGKECRSR